MNERQQLTRYDHSPMRPDSAFLRPLHDFLLSPRSESGEALSSASPVRPLQCAVADGRVDVVSWFLSKGADVHKRDSSGATLLHTAVDHGHIDLVRLLLDHGADVNATGPEGRAPMHLVPAGRSDIIDLLVDSGSHVGIKDYNGNSALMLAVFQGQPERVKTYLRHEADVNAAEPISALIDVVSDPVLPPILVAIHEQHNVVLEILLQHGADLRAKFTEDGQTVLHHAVKTRNHGAVLCLILAKMDLDVKDAQGRTALHNLASEGSGAHSDISLELLSAGADTEPKTQSGLTALHIAAQEGALEVAQLLLRAGANITTQACYGRTPLHYAARHSHLEIVQRLLDQGAAIHARDSEGETALHLASRDRGNKGLSVIKHLLSRGASVLEAADADKAYGRLPPHQAAIHGNQEAVGLFLNEGFDKNATDARGWGMIHYAAVHGHADVLKLLLERGTRSGCSTRNECYRPLHLAAWGGHVEAISVLCEFGASVHVETWKEGYYPIHFAAHRGHTNVISLLHEKGANIDARDGYNNTALFHAVRQDQTPAVSLLCEYGASVNHGGQILFEAVSLGLVDIVSILCQRGANVHTNMDSGYAPLFEATRKGHIKVVEVLLDNNANVDVQTNNGGRTSLHVAASIGNKEMVNLLLRRGANPELVTKDKETALTLAQKWGHHEVCKILETARTPRKSDASGQASDSSGNSMTVEAPRRAKMKK